MGQGDLQEQSFTEKERVGFLILSATSSQDYIVGLNEPQDSFHFIAN